MELTGIVRLDELEWSGSNAVISHLLEIVLGLEHHCSVFGQGERQFGVGSLQMQSDGVLADLFRLGNRVLDQAHATEHVKAQRGDNVIGGQFGAVVEHDTFVEVHLPHVQCIIGRQRASQFQLRIQVFVNPGEGIPDRARQKVDVVVGMFATIRFAQRPVGVSLTVDELATRFRGLSVYQRGDSVDGTGECLGRVQKVGETEYRGTGGNVVHELPAGQQGGLASTGYIGCHGVFPVPLSIFVSARPTGGVIV